MAKASRPAPKEGPSAKAARLTAQSFPRATEGRNQLAESPDTGAYNRNHQLDDQGERATNDAVNRLHNSPEQVDAGQKGGNLDPTGNIDQDTLLEVQRTGGKAGRIGGSTTVRTGLGLSNT